jgi:site-specific recombinase XerC
LRLVAAGFSVPLTIEIYPNVDYVEIRLMTGTFRTSPQRQIQRYVPKQLRQCLQHTNIEAWLSKIRSLVLFLVRREDTTGDSLW